MKIGQILIAATFLFSALPCIGKETATPKTGTNGQTSLAGAEAKESLRWYYHQPFLINAEEDYSLRFDAYGNPDVSETMSPYHPNVAYHVNEAQYLFSATDSTDETIDLLPNNRLDVIANYNSNGAANVHIAYSAFLPEDSQIWTDSRTINDVNSAFVMPNNTTMIGTGLVLWRSSVDGTFEGWDGCCPLSSFANNSELTLSFATDRMVQIATLMEIESHDDGAWIFQRHTYSHVVGIYSFRTTSII